MKRVRLTLLASIVPLLLLGELALTAPQTGPFPPLTTFPDATGQIRTTVVNVPLDPNNVFFKPLGTNGRSCGTCHQASDGWSITPAHIRDRFEKTQGLDPLFRSNDGANCPTSDMSTVAARRKSCSMLLNRGLIRIGLPIPANAEFTLVDVDDPYGYASSQELSLYRRPLPSTNLRFLSGVMWDGRETVAGQSIKQDLMTQALDATTGHAQAKNPPTQEQLQQIVALETNMYTAQAVDQAAGRLYVDGGQGGPNFLVTQEFYIGINDPLGGNPTGALFDPAAFSIYNIWANLPDISDPQTQARKAIARGQVLFNTKTIAITGVRGLNDALGKPLIVGTCTTCHDSPNAGDHSVALPLDLGLTNASRRTPDMPLYTLRNNITRETIQTTDPGRALITGKWKDIARFKGPVLRGLAARPPYFHNGFAADLNAVVDFYNTRFNIGFNDQEKSDLVAFLRAL